FIVVPALVLVVGLSMDAAVATSLLVISFNGAVGVISYAAQGRAIDYSVAGIFVAGGLAGMWVGQKTGNHLNERMLSRLFAAVLLLVAMFLIYKNI
ncbi:MAG: sulfite exporter TauE/SafE family protein, partial [Nitrospinaceae bacterium]|nr:sulfite exporter TauE/SafE family protein [Nitrospinaceae bacterium]